MMKEMYDASIHGGQFSLNEDTRVRCKNAQVRISSKQQQTTWSLPAIIWVCTFWENTESDNVIWETLTRKEQDVFYPWMDVYHTIKHIEKIRDANIIASFDVYTLQKDLGCTFSSALIFAWAVLTNTNTIYTLYDDLLIPTIVDYMKNNYDIVVAMPFIWEELSYIGWEKQPEDWKVFDLESLYIDAMNLYRERNINLLQNLFDLQEKEKRL